MSQPDFQEIEIENLREELNNLQIQFYATSESRKQFAQLAKEQGASKEALLKALKGTLYLFEGKATTKADIEQIAFAKAEIAKCAP